MIKSYRIVTLFIFLSSGLLAQNNANKKSDIYLSVSSGMSFATTGDIPGFYLSTGIQKNNKRWTHSFELSTSIHDGFDGLFYQLSPTSPLYDGSIRYSTAGVQLSAISSLAILKNQKNNFGFGLGVVLRYQSTSLYDMYETQYPAYTGLSYPVIIFRHREPMRTFAVAPITQLFYQYAVSKKWLLGLNVSFQVDTNGDNFFNRGLKLGYKL